MCYSIPGSPDRVLQLYHAVHCTLSHFDRVRISEEEASRGVCILSFKVERSRHLAEGSDEYRLRSITTLYFNIASKGQSNCHPVRPAVFAAVRHMDSLLHSPAPVQFEQDIAAVACL